MKSLLLIYIFLNFSNTWAASFEDAEIFQDLISKAILTNQQVKDTGVAVSVFSKDVIILQKGYGYSNRELKRPVTAHTAFAIGSTTKAFTSLGLKLLENKQQLKITQKVSEYLPDFKLSDPVISKQVTIEDLLSHRIGLPRHDLLWYLANFTKEDLFERLQYLDFPEKAQENFRKIFSYNNLMFMSAGLITEKISGQKWETYTQENILDKLEMNETFFSRPVAYFDVATPYYKEMSVNHKDISNVAPAGGMYSTVVDMTKWVQSFMEKKWLGQDDLFKARVGLNNKNPSLEYGYGLAWMINKTNPKYSWYFHNGNIDGFTAMVFFSPELDLGVVILVNQNVSNLTEHIIGSLLQFELSKYPINKSFSSLQKIFLVPDVDQNYLNFMSETQINAIETMTEIKRFINPGYGVVETFVENDKFFASYYGNIWELKVLNNDEQFNYTFDLTLGGDRLNGALKLEENNLYIPFENEVPFIKFLLKR